MTATRTPIARLLVFAGGDFAFNLYWQSAMLYLLFYYTDTLGLAVETAAAIYLAASVWDGIVSFAVGAWADRRGSARSYRLALLLGGPPLGLAFVMTYLAPPFAGAAAVMFVIAGHLLFRTTYAIVNVPYLAMSARVSADSRDRSLVAGLRMLAGTAAGVLVAIGTVPVGRWLAGPGPGGFGAVATVFAIAATAILLIVGAGFRDHGPTRDRQHPAMIACLVSLMRNRAFVTLNAAMMAMIVAVTILNKSVLYYFKYFLHDEAAGQLALASMMAVSAIAVPAWMLLARIVGARASWFVAVAACIAGLIVFALADMTTTWVIQSFLVGIQAAVVGLHFAYWALLPDTVEFGQHTTGVRVEGLVFGLAALLQRVSIGVATAILGLSLGSAGYTANVAQGPETLATMRITIALVPLAFLTLSGLVMLLNPLRQGAHDRIVRDLAAG